MRKRIGKIGALVVLGMFIMLMFVQPVAASDITMNDDDWIGLGASAGRIAFDSTPSPDQIEIMDADVGINDDDPDFRLEIAGNSGSGYLGISSAVATDGDIFIIDSSGKVGIGVTSPAEKLEVNGNFLFSTGADRTLNVEAPSEDQNGYDLTIAAGNPYHSPSFGRTGGDLFLKAGRGISGMDQGYGGDVYVIPGSAPINVGDVIIAHDGSTAYGKVGIGTTSPSALLHVDQSSTTGAQPVLTVDQADVSEEFIKFIGTSSNGVLTQSIVEDADVTTSTLQGWLKIYVQDDGNQLTDQAYYVPIYTLA